MANKDALVTGNTQSQANLCAKGYLVIVAGQSNATDYFIKQGNLPASINDGPNYDLYTFFKNDTNYWNATQGNWVAMNPGVNTNIGTQSSTKFGIGIIIAKRISTQYSKTAYIIPSAVSNTYLAVEQTPSWNKDKSPTTDSLYYNCMANCFRQAYNTVIPCNLTPVLLYVQGENDTDTAPHGSSYGQSLIDLINQFRIDTGFLNMKVIVARIRSDYNNGPGNNPGLNGVRSGQVTASQQLSNVHLFETETSRSPLSPDLIHYNPQSANFSGTQSIINMGNDIADLIATF